MVKSYVLSALMDYLNVPAWFAAFQQLWFPGEGEQLPHWWDLKCGIVFMFWFYLVREYMLGKLMIERLGAYLGIMVDSIALKLVNQWLNLGMHIFSTVWSVWYLSYQSWVYELAAGNSSALYLGIARGGIPMTPGFKMFYNLHLGYQLHALQFTIMEGRNFKGDRRTDFHEMLVHHVIAVTLIATSYLCGFVRVGILTMLFHNASDIVVCLTKSAKLLGWRRLSIWLLPVMMLTWFGCRMFLFPTFVLRHAIAFPILQQRASVALSYATCIGGILILFGLNFFWFWKFLQMSYNVIFHGNAADVTESVITNQVADKYGLWNRQRWWQVGVASQPE